MAAPDSGIGRAVVRRWTVGLVRAEEPPEHSDGYLGEPQQRAVERPGVAEPVGSSEGSGATEVGAQVWQEAA